MKPVSVFQDWYAHLPMQQQSVLVLACRGPDGIAKFHPCKDIVARYRACVLKAAHLGRPMHIDEGDDTTFMTMIKFSDDAHWLKLVEDYFNHVDSLPHHYHMHLMHGAQIIGYKHSNPLVRRRWFHFYGAACRDLHLNFEEEDEMDQRLSDWHRQYWQLEKKAAS